MMALIERVKKIAQGAALMTETMVEHQVISAVSNLLGNTPLEEAMQVAMDTLGGVAFDDADRGFAAKIQATLSAEDIAASYRRAATSRCANRSEEHTSELQSLMRTSYAVFCWKKKKRTT